MFRSFFWQLFVCLLDSSATVGKKHGTDLLKKRSHRHQKRAKNKSDFNDGSGHHEQFCPKAHETTLTDSYTKRYFWPSRTLLSECLAGHFERYCLNTFHILTGPKAQLLCSTSNRSENMFFVYELLQVFGDNCKMHC